MPTKGEDTRVVNFSLDESSRVEVTRILIQVGNYARGDMKIKINGNLRFGANLESNAGRSCLGVVYGLGTSFDIRAHTVVVARGKGAQVGETVERDGVLGCGEADRGRVLGDTALGDVVGSLRTDEEAITPQHSVGGKSGALCGMSEWGNSI